MESHIRNDFSRINVLLSFPVLLSCRNALDGIELFNYYKTHTGLYSGCANQIRNPVFADQSNNCMSEHPSNRQR